METRQNEDSTEHQCSGMWEGVTMPGGLGVLPEEVAAFEVGLRG